MRLNKAKLAVAISFFVATLCVSYAVSQHFFYARKAQQISRNRYRSSIINEPLPSFRLVDFAGTSLDGDELRRGKVILVLLSSECDACIKEGMFLKKIVGKYEALRFYGVLMFWSDYSIDKVEANFPIKLFFDEHSLLRKSFEIKSVPIKLFVENGIVRKVWTGAATNSQIESAFIRDLEELHSR